MLDNGNREKVLGELWVINQSTFEAINCQIPAGSGSTDICGVTVSMNSTNVHGCG